jgi:hypothetical protein
MMEAGASSRSNDIYGPMVGVAGVCWMVYCHIKGGVEVVGMVGGEGSLDGEARRRLGTRGPHGKDGYLWL